MTLKASIRILALLSALGLCFAPALSEDVEKKFRIGFSAGMYNAQDEVASEAANTLIVLDRDLELVNFYLDPRDDSAVFGNLEMQPGLMTTLYGQYAFNKIFMMEATVGYGKTDIGDIEMQIQFDDVAVPLTERFNFNTFRVSAGEIEMIPIQITALARFRPRAKFNPYLGGGLGYMIVGFESSDELNQISANMDASIGSMRQVTGSFDAAPAFIPIAGEVNRDLEGAQVDARDTFTWHLAGGAEYALKRNWALFLDLRLSFSSRDFSIGFNGGESLGRSVPNRTDFDDSEAGTTLYGPVRITSGGLIDGGSLAPEVGAPSGTDCTVSAVNCEFVEVPDGELDTGFHYVQGGSFGYGGVSAQFGFRYTF